MNGKIMNKLSIYIQDFAIEIDKLFKIFKGFSLKVFFFKSTFKLESVHTMPL